MQDWRNRTIQATFVLLAASAVLIGSGLAGFGASGPLLAVFFALAAMLAAFRPQIAALPSVWGYDVGSYLRDLWSGPVIAAVLVLIIEPSASPGELQSIGGIAGFIGMVNYFIRPLYFVLYGLIRRVVAAVTSSA